MLAGHVRLLKILFVIISIKLFIVVVFFGYDNTNEVVRPQRFVIIDELLVDKSDEPSWADRLKLIRKEMPSFPLEEMHRRPAGIPKCGKVPSLMEIDFSNDYWQTFTNVNLTYHIYGAYYDNRETMSEAPLVRVLTMINHYGKRGEISYPETFCQIWFKGRVEPVVVNVTDHKLIWYWGGASPYVFPTLLSCCLPKANVTDAAEAPEMVSLVTQPCNKPRNLMRVIYEPDDSSANATDAPQTRQQEQTNSTQLQRKPLRFMVCVKSMDFIYKDMSWRLIEWLELMRLLGAGKVVFYDSQMHPNMTRVLNDYMQSSPGFVEVRPLSMARGEPHAVPHFQHYVMQADSFNRILNEMIPYNDCFYRNMYKYDYIGAFDTDEVIMPLGNVTNWSDLIDLAYKVPDYQRETWNCSEWASFCFRNVYFPAYPERPKVYKKLPSFYYMLQHVERVSEPCDRYSATKCLHSTRYVIGLHNHFPLFRAEKGECEPKSVPVEYAQLQHYREPDNKTRLLNPIIDDSIWRFQPLLQQRVYAQYERLGFLPSAEQVLSAQEQRHKDDELLLSKSISMG
ncbi:uncharacterized protein LOC6584253 [Drosophila mojavensis]|uniref:Glycosyltransferase family 92 protein n=1 Tax=Drosophila mojavensis TaxID=7230 RepID=B4L3U8_DROMO|nr:uncharacterized protein LOC6584253 [Drosophila mojavensis]XP_043867360.1 uncharacterized protein LOC6584253 [Drosophila mojavensis]EDW07226.1 uncharacterized protein Dmoj_GI15623, isoform A [Drosophila mojavensis]KRF93979.1 uncharacterized protein Dmoj_GI15623, isoform B [Drosophila mojavensis]